MSASQSAFDPYAELELARDATGPQVRRAYRTKAKSAHPDAKGGTAEAFQRLRLAMVVLIDPAKREKYDRTGSADDDAPDNSRAAALQVIEKHVGDLVQAYIAGGFQPADDPRRSDMVGVVKKKIRQEMAQFAAGVATGEMVATFLRDLATRLKTTEASDPVGASIALRIVNTQQQIASLRAGLECRQLALDILKAYRFSPTDAFVWSVPF